MGQGENYLSERSKSVIENLEEYNHKADLDENIYSTDRFKYPDMGDYYLNAVDDPYFKRLQVAMEAVGIGTSDNLETGFDPDSDTADSDAVQKELLEGNSATAMQFYMDGPPQKIGDTVGDYPELGVVFFKARVDVSEDSRKMGFFDADTLRFELDTVDAGSQAVNDYVTGSNAKGRIDNGNSKNTAAAAEAYNLGSVRILGINAPEVAHWSYHLFDNEYYEKNAKELVREVEYGKVKDDSNYNIVINPSRASSAKLWVIRKTTTSDEWYELLDGTVNIKQVATINGETYEYARADIFGSLGESDAARINEGIVLQKKVQALIAASGNEVYFMIDKTTLNYSGDNYPLSVFGSDATMYDESKFTLNGKDVLLSQILDYNRYKYAGFAKFGADKYNRWLGNAYVKFQGQWINLAKYLITQSTEMEVLPDYTSQPIFENNGGTASEAFNLQSYDYDNKAMHDVHGEVAKMLDDRRRVQQDIFGVDFDAMKEWNVTIGDTTFFIPPTSIRSSVSTTYERLPIIRGKGAMTKGGQKLEKMIELTIYFNEEKGINGYPYTDTLPNGEKITYYMNGLRALISQFKFTPFLPIENEYINKVLNVEAVSLRNIQVQATPKFPRLYQATITLERFDFYQFLPELPMDLTGTSEYYNPFSTVFNFALMRWYYQRPLILGNKLKDVSINDLDYLKQIEGRRTALMPMKFRDSGFKIYLANEEHLKKMQQIKIYRTRDGNRTVPLIEESEEQLINDMVKAYDNFLRVSTSESIQGELEKLNKLQAKGPFFFHIPDVGKSKKSTSGILEWSSAAKGYIKLGTVVEPTTNLKGETVYPVQEMAYNDEMFEAIDNISQLTADLIAAASTDDVKFVYDRTYLRRTGSLNNEEGQAVSSGEKIYLSVSMSVRSNNYTSSALDNIIRSAELHLKGAGMINETLSGDLKKGNIVVEFEISADPKKNGTGSIDDGLFTSQLDGFKFGPGEAAGYMHYLQTLSDNIAMDGYANSNSEVEALSQDADFLNTLTYDEVELGPVNIENISCAFGNTFTRVGLNGTEGYASQFMGGQDTVVELSFQTTNEYAVSMMNALPSNASYLVSTYKQVLPAAPIVFESELTRLMGVREVAVEEVQVETVQGQPGLYNVVVRMISMDRTLRQREGVEKINEFAYGGKTTTEGTQNIKNRTFAELNKRLGEAELYPDLELPTLEELKTVRFDFLRHTFDRTRVYPDPDFYFNYGHVLQSQIFREAVIQTSDEGFERSYKESDGDEYTKTVAKDMGTEESGHNASAKKKLEDSDKQRKVSEAKTLNVQYIDKVLPEIDILNNFNVEEHWDIGEDIKVLFMEDAYKKALDQMKNPYAGTAGKEKVEWLVAEHNKIEKVVETIDAILSGPVSINSEKTTLKQKNIRKAATKVLERDRWRSIFETLGVSKSFGDSVWLVSGNYEDFCKVFGNLVFAAACAATGKKEYRDKSDEVNWHPDKNFIGYKPGFFMEATGDVEIRDIKDVSQATQFSIFGIKMYDRQLWRAINKDVQLHTREKDTTDINTQMFLLDPYYAKADVDTIVDYKKNCVENLDFATEAYLRTCLVWLRRLVLDRVIPNMTMDIFGDEFEKELSGFLDSTVTTTSAASGGGYSNLGPTMTTATDTADANGTLADAGLTSQVKEYLDFLSESKSPIDNGKAFLLTALTLGEERLYKLVRERNHYELNQLKYSATTEIGNEEKLLEEDAKIRKLFFAMDGLNLIEGIESLSSRSDNIVKNHMTMQLDRKYIEFADDANIFTRHAFYDMCVHDMRGRMARAFPSFYMVLIDEGMEIGMYKLNDNFYNVNGVSEIQVHRSRKIPADTCRIVLSNLYQSYTTHDEDRNVSYTYNPLDIFNSVFRTSKIYEREQEKRLRQQPLNKVKLQAGTRIHVRMGYGGNAATLPVAFNGRITEINAGDIMELVCQGDGIELTNQFAEEMDAEEVQNEDRAWPGFFNFFTEADTPKNIIDGILNTKGGFWREFLKDKTNNYFKNPHKYGITNFGDTRINTIFREGEVVQNIFEGIPKPLWGDLDTRMEGDWNLKEAPKISTELMGKTVWDVLHFCASATPDFIIGVSPFGMRSTIFHGLPRFYYAFDYVLDEQGNIAYEKRKPYQQYHMVTSFSDIIKNNIRADATRIKTNAVGTYKEKQFFGGSAKTTDRLYADYDIYPEHQKSMVYDTQYFAKGIPGTTIIDEVITWTDKKIEFLTEDYGETSGVVQDERVIARRMTANALKDSMRDMYAGEIIMLGIPSLKPHDRLIINDTYENMTGHVTVESHTLSLSTDTGLTSTVVPDLITSIEDQFELAARQVTDTISAAATTFFAATLITSMSVNRGSSFSRYVASSVLQKTPIVRKWADNSSLLWHKGEDGATKATQKAVMNRAAKTAEKTAWSAAKRVGGSLAGRAMMGTTAGAPGIAAAVLWTAVEFLAIQFIGTGMKRKLEKRLLNGRMLTFFPVKHNGKVMTAGLTGEVGQVVGSANFGRMGFLENMTDYITGKGGTESWSWITEFIMGDEFTEFAEAYIEQRPQNSTAEESQIQDSLSKSASMESSKIAGYRKLLAKPRVELENKEDANYISNEYIRLALVDGRAIESNTRIGSENLYIENDNVIKQYIDSGFLRHIWSSTNDNYKSEQKMMFIGGNKKAKILCYYKDGKKGKIWDVPFLKEDAMIVLKTILTRTYARIPMFDEDKDSTDLALCITSALIVGEENPSLGGMGYSFTIEAEGDGMNEYLQKELDALIGDNLNLYNEGYSMSPKLFDYEPIAGTTKYKITVLPAR